MLGSDSTLSLCPLHASMWKQYGWTAFSGKISYTIYLILIKFLKLLLTQEMCKVIHNPCRIVELEHRGGWPDFMRCDDLEKFPPGCKVQVWAFNSYIHLQIYLHFWEFQNEVRELKFNNITPKCQSPLVETNNNQAFVDGVDGCGLPCNSPLFSREEHEQVQRFTQTLAAMCLATNLFAVVSKWILFRFFKI